MGCCVLRWDHTTIRLPLYAESAALSRKAFASEKNAEEAPDDDAKSGGSVELYNLTEDIGETKNLAASRPDKVKELRARLDAFLKNAAPPGNAAAKPAGRVKARAR